MKRPTTLLIILVTLFFLMLLFSSCDAGLPAPESKRLLLDQKSQYSDQNYKVYTLEGCEYISIGYGKDRWGSHKGNCKNPIHYVEKK